MSHDDPAIPELIAEVIGEYATRYDESHDDIAPTSKDATWLLVRAGDGTPLGCGAVQPWSHTILDAPPEVGEVKRMYVRPAARGLGLSRVLLDGLIEGARERGMTALVLETGTEQPEALALYTSSGFILTESWGPYCADPRTRCFRLDIPPTSVD